MLLDRKVMRGLNHDAVNVPSSKSAVAYITVASLCRRHSFVLVAQARDVIKQTIRLYLFMS